MATSNRPGWVAPVPPMVRPLVKRVYVGKRIIEKRIYLNGREHVEPRG